jgi:hypothetical protein
MLRFYKYHEMFGDQLPTCVGPNKTMPNEQDNLA